MVSNFRLSSPSGVLLKDLPAHQWSDRAGSLTAESEKALQEWCCEYGLLGILPHRAVHMVFEPFEDPLPAETMVPILKLLAPYVLGEPGPFPAMFSQIHYVRTNCGWRGWRLPAATHPNPDSIGVFGHALAAQYRLERIFAPSEMVDRFFPRLAHQPPNKHAARCPVPLSTGFWHCYAERIEDFLEGAALLYEAVAATKLKRRPRSKADTVAYR